MENFDNVREGDIATLHVRITRVVGNGLIDFGMGSDRVSAIPKEVDSIERVIRVGDIIDAYDGLAQDGGEVVFISGSELAVKDRVTGFLSIIDTKAETVTRRG